MGDDDDVDDTTLALTPYNDCNWSDLHEDLLELILKEIIIIKEEELVTTVVADCLRFGSVCVSWRSVLVPHFHPELLHPQLPLLMIPSLPWPKSLSPSPSPSSPNNEEEEEEEKEETRSFYSLSERRVISEEDLKIKLPYNRYCRGCSYGWIIATGNEDAGFSVELLNPFISINNDYQKIQLPPLTTLPYDPVCDVFHNDYMEKAVLSANPTTTTTDYVVMAIYRNSHLGFWKPGNEVWIDIPIQGEICIYDVIYHHSDGLFYFVNGRGEVMVCDLDHGGGGTPTVRKIAPSHDSHPMLTEHVGFKSHLVESLGDLLILCRLEEKFWVIKFLGDKKNEEEEKEEEVRFKELREAEWKIITNLRSLPDRMLFVGDNTSMSLSASDFIGGKSSCIYFTDDSVYSRDVGFPRCICSCILLMYFADFLVLIVYYWNDFELIFFFLAHDGIPDDLKLLVDQEYFKLIYRQPKQQQHCSSAVWYDS